MYKFIDTLLTDKEKLLEQIRIQNKLGLEGYYANNELQFLPFDENSDFKCALKLITQQQSVFSIVDRGHQLICLPLLELIYNRKTKEYEDNDNVLIDVLNCIKNGVIYIKDLNTDFSSEDEEFPLHIRKFYIYVPHYFNRYQIEEIKKTIEVRNKYKKRFKDDFIAIIHYLDEELGDRKVYVNQDIYNFINEISHKYIREVEADSDERILVDTYRSTPSIASKRRIEFLSFLQEKTSGITQNSTVNLETRDKGTIRNEIFGQAH